MKKSEILKMIREEVEVVLTNAEAVEVFDLDPAALLDEVLGEEKDDNWIQKAVPADDPDRGKFSAAAKKAGMSTCDYAKKINRLLRRVFPIECRQPSARIVNKIWEIQKLTISMS